MTPPRPTILALVAPALLALVLLAAACAAPPGPAPAPTPEDRIRRIETGLLTHNVVPGQAPFTLQERLRFYRVPALSIAVIEDGRIAWARAWGTAEAGGDVPVDTTTLFQAASISKPVAAAGALRLVERGLLDLDGDVNERLRAWRIPENGHTRVEKVTLRRLLSHTAGTTVHGFPGYAAGAAVPALVGVLEGAVPANTAPVRVDTVPGSLWRYSGGGTSVAQLLMMDVTGRAFPELMRELVLGPAGMARSTYEQPLPAARAGEAATAHGPAGLPVAGRYHTYPEMAAAGLWTTPSDLARFALEIRRAFLGQPGAILSQEIARAMLTEVDGGYGLGFSLEPEDDGDVWFSHGGSNRGFRAYLTLQAGAGRGAVVMTNGHGGGDVAMEVLRAVAREYGWPAYLPNEREALALGPDELADYVGAYRGTVRGRADQLMLEVSLHDDGLRARVPPFSWDGRALRAAAPDTFFFLETPGELAFERDAEGVVRAVVLTGLGRPARAERR